MKKNQPIDENWIAEASDNEKAAKQISSKKKSIYSKLVEETGYESETGIYDPVFRNGAKGCIEWIEKFCYIPIYPFSRQKDEQTSYATWCRVGDLPDNMHPITSKSYREIWAAHKRILKEALVMNNGLFKYKLIIFCWMRGEGKSLLACLIQLWKYFNFPRQQIVLGANSKDQIKFVHFDIIKDVIVNSPALLDAVGGKRNLQEKEIRIKDSFGNIRSVLRPISTSSGIVSNITGYTFSEIFDMKNPKFFVQLDGSIRNMPNALGVVDSTVSSKQHILYNLYSKYLSGETQSVYFSYRYSLEGHQDDYWNPNMDQIQLNDYRAKFPLGDFERYFLNTWEAGEARVFNDTIIREMNVMGVENRLLDHVQTKGIIQEIIETKYKHEQKWNKIYNEESKAKYDYLIKIESLENKLIPVDRYYSMEDSFQNMRMATCADLETLGDILDTDFAILIGTDFGDPLATQGLARTIYTVVAKCLPGSRKAKADYHFEETNPKYFYFLLYLKSITTHSITEVKREIEETELEYGGIDNICSERTGLWDLKEWCEDKQIALEPIYPSYSRQKEVFKEFYTVANEGRFKTPYIPTKGTKTDNILKEEMETFTHDLIKQKFGSPEKFEKHGIQDDTIYAIAYAIYGGRNTSFYHFRPRKKILVFGEMYHPREHHGKY